MRLHLRPSFLNRDSPVATGLPSTGCGTEFSSPPGRKCPVKRNFQVIRASSPTGYARKFRNVRRQPKRFSGRDGAIGFFLLIFVVIVLMTAMGLFVSVQKGSEHGVFTRFHTRTRMANGGAIAEARASLATPWNISAAPTTYDVYVDTDNVTTVTIDSIGAP